MYAGQSVEGGPSDTVIQEPKHPYTQLLISAAPDPDRPAAACRSRSRRDTQPDHPTIWLPLPSALPTCHAGLSRAFPWPHGPWRWPLDQLLPLWRGNFR